MGAIRNRHWERNDAYRILVVKPEVKGLGILYKTLIARKFSILDDGLYRPKHVVFHC